MSSRRRYRRSEPTDESVPIDPFEDLGPGDLGYRLRGGRTGFDPFENALEQGRFGGMALKSLFSNPIARVVAIVLGAAMLTSLVASGDWTAIAIIIASVAGVWLLRTVATEDLERLRRNRDS